MRSLRIGAARREAAAFIDTERSRSRIHTVRSSHYRPAPLADLIIIDGATIYNSGGTTYYGIKRSSSYLTSVGVQYDPDVDVTPGTFTAVDGIGRALRYVNNVQTPTVPVLVLLDPNSPIPLALVNADQVLSDTVLMITGPSAPLAVYIPRYI